MRLVRTGLLLIVIAAALVGGAVWWEDRNFNASGPSEKEAVVLIRPGGGARSIAASLAEAASRQPLRSDRREAPRSNDRTQAAICLPRLHHGAGHGPAGEPQVVMSHHHRRMPS